DRGEIGVERIDPPGIPRRGGFQLGDLLPVRIRSGTDHLADAPARLVPLRLEGIGLRDQSAAALIELDGTVDNGGILPLVGGGQLQTIGILPETLQPDAHALIPAPAAWRRRSRTKDRSSAASSQ